MNFPLHVTRWINNIMIHFDFKVDQIDAENILNAIVREAVHSLDKSSDMNRTESEREYYKKDHEYQLKLINLMKYTRVT